MVLGIIHDGCWDHSEHHAFWKKPTGISQCDCSQTPRSTAPHNPEDVLHWEKGSLQPGFKKTQVIPVGAYRFSFHGDAGPSVSTLLHCYLVTDNAASVTLVNPYFNSYNQLWNGGRRGAETQISVCCVIAGKAALMTLVSHTEECKNKYHSFMRAGAEKGHH